MKSALKLLSIFALITTAFLFNASATILIPKSLAQLTSEAGVIGEFVVASQSVAPGPHGPCTWVNFTPVDVVKGTVGAGDLSLRFEGGRNGDGTTSYVVGMPMFSPGERVFLFVRADLATATDYASPIVGWGQGTFRIATNSKGHDVIRSNSGDLVTDYNFTTDEFHVVRTNYVGPNPTTPPRAAAPASGNESSIVTYDEDLVTGMTLARFKQTIAHLMNQP